MSVVCGVISFFDLTPFGFYLKSFPVLFFFVAQAMDPSQSAAANLFSLSALAALQPSVAHFQNHSGSLEFTGTPLGAEAEAKLIDYRNEKVAGFEVENDTTLICLPQAYELFLKHLVGGLHTVYTKLKRLDIVPKVCNVEQVRALRSLGAIQPGVNRCKLISTTDFDALYADCTTASSRPGRPPKRSPPFSGGTNAVGVESYLNSIKKQRFGSEPSEPMKAAAAAAAVSSMAGGGGGGAGLFSPQQLFPFLNPFAAQQIMMSQMLNSANANAVKQEPGDTDQSGTPEPVVSSQNNNFLEKNRNLNTALYKCQSGISTTSSSIETNSDDPLNLVKNNRHQPSATVNGEAEEDDGGSENLDSGGETPTYSQNLQSQHSGQNQQPNGHLLWPGFPLNPELFRGSGGTGLQQDCFSVESLLLNVLGLIEIAASAVKKQELSNTKDREETTKQLETLKTEKASLEASLKEETRTKKMYQKRLKLVKKSKAEIQNQLLTLLETQQSQGHLQGHRPPDPKVHEPSSTQPSLHQ